MRNQTKGSSGWHRLGALMIAMERYEKAEEFYRLANGMTSEDDWKELAYLRSQRGHIRDELNDPEAAQEYYEDALQIQLEHLPDDHPDLARNYTGIGSAMHAQYQLDDALEHFHYALHIACQISRDDQLEIAKIHSFIGRVYNDQREYDQALESHTHALYIREKRLPKGHPSVAIIFNNIGTVYESLPDYSKALSYFEKTLEIGKKSLPSNHPSLAATYHNIANVLDCVGRYQGAVRKQKHAVQIVRNLYEPADKRRQDEEQDLQRMQDKLENS